MLDAEAGSGQRFRGADHAARDDAAVILVSNNAHHLTSVAERERGPGSTPGSSGSRPADPRRARRGRALRGYDTEVVIAAGLASVGRRGAGRRRVGANGRYVPDEGQQSARGLRFARGPIGETRLQFVERIADAYGLVLLLILATFVLTVTLPPEGWAGRVAAIAFAGATAVIALTSSNARLVRVRIAIGAALTAVVAAALAKATSSDALLGAAFIIDSLLLLIAATTILRRVVGAAEVDFRTILGAISVFTLLGLLFGYLYLALGRLGGGQVFAGVPHAQTRDYLFFSYTTLTTTGYGNLVPAGDVGQILAVFEMLIGQFFLVTLVAGLVSLWRPGAKGRRKAEGRDEQPT